MTVPGRDSSTRPDRRKGERRTRARKQSTWEIILGVLILLAIVASIIMIFTDSVPLLRFGVVAALWAAVVGAIAMTKFRKESENDAARARDLKLVYELQLEREIAARREYELVVESQVRRQVEERVRHESSEEIESLRMEMAALRSSLEALFDGELPDERLAVRAESHRLHELSGGPGQMVAAQAAELPEIDDVVAVDGVDESGDAFEPDYEAYREAAQFMPGVGDEAPVTAETQAVADAEDSYTAAADAGGAYGAGEYDAAEDVEDVDAEDVEAEDVDAEDVDTEDVDTEDVDTEDAEYEDAADEDAADEDAADEDEVATDSTHRAPADGAQGTGDEDDDTDSPSADDGDAAEGEAPDGTDAEESDAEDPDADGYTAEHGTRPGGNTVAELLARMRESGTVPENLGRRRRRADD